MKRLVQHLKSFRDDTRGSIAVETVLVIPALFWAYLTMFAIFDAYRQHSISFKAAYSIGDMISRQTTPLTGPYLAGMRETLAYITNNSVDDVSVRVTSVRYNAVDDKYELDWSNKRGSLSTLTDSDVAALADRLPILPDQEYVTVVETFVDYEPPFNTGLMDREIATFVFTRPRYAPRVCWSSRN